MAKSSSGTRHSNFSGFWAVLACHVKIHISLDIYIYLYLKGRPDSVGERKSGNSTRRSLDLTRAVIMTGPGIELHSPGARDHDNSSSSTIVPTPGNSAFSVLGNMNSNGPPRDVALAESGGMKELPNTSSGMEATVQSNNKQPFKKRLRSLFAPQGNLRPFRLLKQDIKNIRIRYVSDWTTFNQLVFASAVYVFFSNLLPGITFASDLYVLTGKTWGTIEVVFSTGLCGFIFSL